MLVYVSLILTYISSYFLIHIKYIFFFIVHPKLTYLKVYFNLFSKSQFSFESINILSLHFVGENLFLVMDFLCLGDYLESKILEFVFLLFGLCLTSYLASSYTVA